MVDCGDVLSLLEPSRCAFLNLCLCVFESLYGGLAVLRFPVNS